MRIRWLVCSVENKAYLREYNVVGVRWWACSCNCAWIYISKLNTINKIMSLQWSNNLEPNIFDEQHQCTIWSLLAHPAVGVQDLEWTATHVFFCISFPRLAQWPGFSPFLWPSRPQCPKFSLIRGAHRCKPLTPTHYSHPPHKDQSVWLYG